MNKFYVRDPHCDCPMPTPDEQLRATGRRSLLGILAVNVLAVIGIICLLWAIP